MKKDETFSLDCDASYLLDEINKNSILLESFKKYINEQLNQINSRIKEEIVNPINKLNSFNINYGNNIKKACSDIQIQILEIENNLKKMNNRVNLMNKMIRHYNNVHQKEVEEEKANEVQ